jgi:hypothetical protein
VEMDIRQRERKIILRSRGLIDNNIYIPVYIFKEIFDTICAGESTIPLSIGVKDDKSQLWYGNDKVALGQGKKPMIEKLKEAIEALVSEIQK